MSGPTVLRPVEGSIRIKMPYRLGNRSLLNRLARNAATWSGAEREWSVHRRHLRQLIGLLLQVWPTVTVLIDVKRHRRCDARCVNAKGDECVCSCAYVNHKGGDLVSGWILVGETTLVSEEIERFRYVVHAVRAFD